MADLNPVCGEKITLAYHSSCTVHIQVVNTTNYFFFFLVGILLSSLVSAQNSKNKSGLQQEANMVINMGNHSGL